MRNTRPTIILNRHEAAVIADAYNATYTAGTQEGTYTATMHADYEAKRGTLQRHLSRLCGIRRGSDAARLVEDAFFDNGPLDVQGVIASLTLTDHNVVLEGLWLAAGSDHYAVRSLVKA